MIFLSIVVEDQIKAFDHSLHNPSTTSDSKGNVQK